MGELDFLLSAEELIKNNTIPKDSKLRTLFDDIRFIILKLHHLKDEINKEYEKVSAILVEKAKEEMENQRKTVLIKAPEIKSNSNELTLTIAFNPVVLHQPLMFHLDTLISDVKRVIEFLLRFIAMSENIGMKDFSLEACMRQLKGEKGFSDNKFTSFLKKDRPIFTTCLVENYEKIIEMNKRRTNTTHYGIFNKTESYEAQFTWNSVQSIYDSPAIISPSLKLFNKSIPDFVRDELYLVRKVVTYGFRSNYKLFDELARTNPLGTKN